MRNKNLVIPVWIKIMLVIDDNMYITSLYHKLGGTYSNISRLCTLMERKGLIKSNSHNRIKSISLTEDGYKFQKGLIPLSNYLNLLNNDLENEIYTQ